MYALYIYGIYSATHEKCVHRTEILHPFADSPNAFAAVPTSGIDISPKNTASIELPGPDERAEELGWDVHAHLNAVSTLADIGSGGNKDLFSRGRTPRNLNAIKEFIQDALKVPSIANAILYCDQCCKSPNLNKHPLVCPYHCGTVFTIAPFRCSTPVNKSPPDTVRDDDETQDVLSNVPSVSELSPVSDISTPPPWTRLLSATFQDAEKHTATASHEWAGESADSKTEAIAKGHRPASKLPLRSSSRLKALRYSPHFRSSLNSPMRRSHTSANNADTLSSEDESSGGENVPPKRTGSGSRTPSLPVRKATYTFAHSSQRRRKKKKKKKKLGGWEAIATDTDESATSTTTALAIINPPPKFCKWRKLNGKDCCKLPCLSVAEARDHAETHYLEAKRIAERELHETETLKCRWEGCSTLVNATTQLPLRKHLWSANHFNIVAICNHCGNPYSRKDSMRRHYKNKKCLKDAVSLAHQLSPVSSMIILRQD